MPSLCYSATFGHETRQIDISQVSGSGGIGTWHVMVDRYLVATVREVEGEILVSPVYGNWMSGGDVEALREIIQKAIRSSE